MSGAINAASQAINAQNQMQAFDMKRGRMLDADKNAVTQRLFENHKLEIQKRRLDEDGKRRMEHMFSLRTVSSVNDRDILSQIKKSWRVSDVYLKSISPSAEQMKYIDSHYSQYGVDCGIYNYTYVHSTYKNKTNI